MKLIAVVFALLLSAMTLGFEDQLRQRRAAP